MLSIFGVSVLLYFFKIPSGSRNYCIYFYAYFSEKPVSYLINLAFFINQTCFCKVFFCYTLHLVDGFDSQILSNEPSNFTKILREWLPKTGSWTACWRATRDGWASSTFHSNCDGKVPTLVIVKVVKDSRNLIFGGYSNHTWADDGKFEFMIIYIYYVGALLHIILQHCHMVLSTEVLIIWLSQLHGRKSRTWFIFIYTFCFPKFLYVVVEKGLVC